MFDRRVLIPFAVIIGFFVLGAVWLTSVNRNPPRTQIDFPKQSDKEVRGLGSGNQSGQERTPRQ